MTGAQTRRTAALDSFLNQAADDLARSSDPPPGNDAEGLLFLGAWHQSYPAILVRDPFLSDSAKVHFLYLMQESSQKPSGAITMPSLEETARVLRHSRKTAGRDRMLLRICRWISLCRSVRDASGRFRGSIYAIHSEPCSLADGSHLDRGYLDLLADASTHDDPFLKQAAGAAYDGIDHALDAGRDPLEAPNPINRRLDAAAAVRSGQGCFFDLLLTGRGNRPNADKPENDAKLGGHPVATHQNDGGWEKFTHGEPCVNSTHGQNQPCVNSTHGNQTTVSADNYKSYPQKEKFTHGYCSSSSTTTTTDETAREEKFTHPPPTATNLHWPEAFDESLQAIICRVMAREAVPQARQQELVDVLAHKAQDVENPLKSPAGYAMKLARRMQSGDFQPIRTVARRGAGGSSRQEANGGGWRNPNQAKRQAIREQIRETQSEIQGLEHNLIPMARQDSKPALEASCHRYKQHLAELKQQYRSLADESA